MKREGQLSYWATNLMLVLLVVATLSERAPHEVLRDAKEIAVLAFRFIEMML